MIGGSKIKVQRERPELLAALPRLLARLHPQSPHYKEISDLLYRAEAGYAGEQRVDRLLEASDFPKPFRVFTDLQLSLRSLSHIQIDTLIVTRFYVLVLEIKNISGSMHYIEHPPHFECIYENGRTIAIGCPQLQLDNNTSALDLWLHREGFNLRSTGLIVMANNKAIIKNVPKQMKIMYAKHLPHYFRTLVYGPPILSEEQFLQLTEHLESARGTYHPYPLIEKYRVNPQHLKKGFLCSNCHSPIHRVHHMRWICSSCEKAVNQPYREGMQDWFMLMKNSITNKECREFFQLSNKDAAHYILKSMPLLKVGQSKSVRYVWDYRNSPSELLK